MNLSTLVTVLIIIVVISFMTFRDLVVSGTLKGFATPSVTSEQTQ